MTASGVRPIVIDDTDKAIRYSGGGWFTDSGSLDGIGNFGPTYLKSLHGTNADGSLAYTFQGTSVQVIGTTRLVKNPDGTFDPSWECFIDNVSIGATKPFEFAENNWTLCEGENLADGQHQLTVKVTVSNNTFWIDRIHYTPSPNVSLQTAVVLVDNHDSGVDLGSGWGALGGTANMTQVTGSRATFLFTGTSVSWVGFVPTELPHNASTATYSVDGGPQVLFPLNGLSPGATTTIYNQVFFKTPDLPPGPHSLVVIHQGTNQQTPLTLDFLYVTNTSIPVSGTSSQSPNPSSSPNPSLNPDTSSTTGTPTSSPLPPNKNDTPVGAIVGGVLGGLGLIALALLLLLWYKRIQRRTEFHDSTIPTMSQRPEVSPYVYHPSASGSYVPDMGYGRSINPSNDLQPQRSDPATSSYNPTLSPVTSPGVESQSTFPTSRHGASASMSSGTTSGYGPNPIPETREMHKQREQALQPLRRAIVHEDSGLRLNRESVVDVPPIYTPD